MHSLRPGNRRCVNTSVILSGLMTNIQKNLAGLKSSGFSHTVGSRWTDQRFGIITVPLGIVYPRNTIWKPPKENSY
ncbi:hypothetical protein ANANG_G00317360 [Anguilla anguilla]|uniref:Uncharacterized protein n=1 Tax=Anguilla anguilla TaxID=7936 RepID=A0A9D3LHX3_ANGAN|nr:hypothetical protein ANANG_G00317360 [Anguilla anguilla]